jgi:hypothetical protein
VVAGDSFRTSMDMTDGDSVNVQRLIRAGVVLAVVLGVAGAGCDPSPPAATGPPSASASGSGGAGGTPSWGPMVGATGLRVLVAGRYIDVDAGKVSALDITEWLRPVAGPPIFLRRTETAGLGRMRVERIRSEGFLPGAPVTLSITGPYYLPAASISGRSVWITEFLSRTRCTLRELWLDGRTKRAARDVACGLTPVAETEAGLWVSKWVNPYTLNGRNVEMWEPTYALLDPATLAERSSHPEVMVMGRRHVLTMDDREQNLVLRGPNGSVKLDKPSIMTGFVFNSHWPVAPVSPDGRYAIVRYGDHGVSPQGIDLWVLDLERAVWLHVPGMPVGGALKFAAETWSSDGRLVMVGRYSEDTPIFATWRPGDAQLAVRAENPVPKDTFDQGFGHILAW